MAKQQRDSKNRVVGLTTSGYGDTGVQQDYGRGVGAYVRRAEDYLGGHKEPEAGYQAPRASSEPKAPVTVKKVDLARPSSFKKGGKVEKTGYAKVHKGEVIVPAEDAMSSKKKSSKKSKKGAKKGKAPHRMHVRGAANGGYIVEHEFKAPKPGSMEQAQENEEHQIPDLESLKDHIAEHAPMMGGNADEEEEGAAGGGAPSAA